VNSSPFAGLDRARKSSAVSVVSRFAFEPGR
jgi:hypothetical protein